MTAGRGGYRFSFQLHNLTDQAQTYALDGSVLTDQVDLTYADLGYTFMGETSRELSADVQFATQNAELPKLYDVNGDGKVDMTDVQVLLDGVNGLVELTESVQADFDLNEDGFLDTADVQMLYEKISAGMTELSLVEVPPAVPLRCTLPLPCPMGTRPTWTSTTKTAFT